MAGKGLIRHFSYQADLITRTPKKELQAVLIKQQHHVASNGREYPLRLPRNHARVRGPVAAVPLGHSGTIG
jgi:hypothetical protein